MSILFYCHVPMLYGIMLSSSHSGKELLTPMAIAHGACILIRG